MVDILPYAVISMGCHALVEIRSSQARDDVAHFLQVVDTDFTRAICGADGGTDLVCCNECFNMFQFAVCCMLFYTKL